MKSFEYLSVVAVLVITLSAFMIPEAHAITTIDLKDKPSCEGAPLSGTWIIANTTCKIGGFTLNPGDTLTIDNSINPNIVLTIIGNLTNGGTISNLPGGIITSKGTINNTGTINNLSGGTINNLSGGTINNLSGGAINNTGTLVNKGTINNFATINNSGTVTNNGIIVISGGAINNLHGGTITNDIGIITNHYKSSINNDGNINNNGGNLTNFSNGTINNLSDGTINNNSDVSTNLIGGSITNFSNGTIKNTGTINNNFGTITNNSGGIIANDQFINNYSRSTINNFGHIINNLGTIDNFGDNSNSAKITNFSGGTITNTGTIYSSEGTITNNSGGTITNFSGGFIYNNVAIINNLSGATINNSGTITNFSGGNITNTGNANNLSGGTITNNSGGTINNNSAIITNLSGATINNLSGGLIRNNSGTINNLTGGTINNSGTLTNFSSGVINNQCGGIYSGNSPIGNPVNNISCSTISINDVSLTEGNSGTKNFDFTVTRTGNITVTSSVNFTTIDGNATIADSDYVANSGKVNFAANETTKTISVIVNGDTKVESDEIFNVNLSNCVGCSINDTQGLGTILNDDSSAISNIDLKDKASCEAAPLSGTWTSANTTCRINGLTLNPGDLLKVDNSPNPNIALTNVGTINNNGEIITGGTITNNGNIVNTGLLNTFLGTVGFLGEYPLGTINNNGNLTNNGTINQLLPEQESAGNINNFGTIINNGGILNLNGFNNSGKLANRGIIANGEHLGVQGTPDNFTNFGTINNTGTIFNSGFSFVSAKVQGIFSNSGNIYNSGTISNTASIFTNKAGGIIYNNVGGFIYNNLFSGGGSTGVFGSIENVGIIYSSGTINNTSTINNSGTVNSTGTIYNKPSINDPHNLSAIINNIGIINNQCGGVYAGNDPVGNPVNFIVCSSHLTVIKRIINDNGGNLTISGVTLFLDGNTVTNGTANLVSADNHTVSEIIIPGYTATFGGDCDSKGTLTLVPGENKTCTITNDDNPAPAITNIDLKDQASCEAAPLSGTWTSANSTCRINGLKLNSGDSLRVDNSTNTNIALTNTGNLTNGGFILNGGIFINKIGTFNNTGTITNDGTTTNGGQIINSGTISNTPGGTINNLSGGVVTNTASGTITNSPGGSIINNSGEISNSGTINNNPGGAINNLSGGIINNLSVGNIANSSNIINNSGGTINNLGTITNTGIITNTPGGTITNNGTINNPSGTINNQCGGVYSGNDSVGIPVNNIACTPISINDVSLTEGNSGIKGFNFTITRGGNTTEASSVNFTTADGTATISDSDYVANSGTVNFAPNETTKIVSVLVNGDTKFELDETFFVNLFGCVGCSITDNQGIGTIQNDDGPTITNIDLKDKASCEAAPLSGTWTSANFTCRINGLTLNHGDSLLIDNFTNFTTQNTVLTNVGNITNDGKITNLGGIINNLGNTDNNFDGTIENIGGTFYNLGNIGNDGTWINDSGGNLTNNPGGFINNYPTGIINIYHGRITNQGDTINNFGTITNFAQGIIANDATLNNPGTINIKCGAIFSGTTPTGNPVNNFACPTVSINDLSLPEGDSGFTNFDFTVTRSGDITGASAVNFTTEDGTATVADSDYIPNSVTVNSVNFAPNETAKIVTVVVIGDTKVEPDETFKVNLSNCILCSINDSQGIGTIQNDDPSGPTAHLTVIKRIINDNGGNLTIGDVTLLVDSTRVTNGTANLVTAGIHQVLEFANPGYTATLGGDCDSNGKVILAPGDNKTCIITNNDNQFPATLTVPSSTGNGSVTFSTDLGGFSSLVAVNQSSLVPPPPAGSYPFGFFSWTISGLGLGQTTTVTITFPGPPGNTYEKLIGGTWNTIPVFVNSNVVNLNVTDGGAGDADQITNGQISDPEGVGVLAGPPPTKQVFCNGKTIDELIASGAYNVIDHRGKPHGKIMGTSKADLILAGDKGDKIYGKQGDDCIIGGKGKDIISGGPGNDIIFGQGGNDKISGNDGNDIIDGGNGSDTISGGNGNDTIYGGNGNDKLYGNHGSDIINGGPGNDRINGGKGGDTCSGGTGKDKISNCGSTK